MDEQKYPERHWMYESEATEPESFPAFMNDGYGPPDWDLIQELNETEQERRD